MTPKNREELIRLLARATAKIEQCSFSDHREGLLADAGVQIAALETAGLRIVPVEPAEAMVFHASFVEPPRPYGKVYRAMLAASPFAPADNP